MTVLKPTPAESRRLRLHTWMRNLGINHATAEEISRTAEAYGKDLYWGQYGDNGVATCRRDLKILEELGRVKRNPAYKNPIRWSVA